MGFIAFISLYYVQGKENKRYELQKICDILITYRMVWGDIMLNPRKIQLMTRLAILEKERGKELRRIKESYRSDYVGIPLLKNALRVTAVFLLVLAVWAVANMEFILDTIADAQLGLLAVGILAAYIVVLLVSLIITFLCISAEYYCSLRAAEEYDSLLEKLASLEEE